MGYVRTLSIPFLFRLVSKASEKELEKQEFEMYCSVLPYLEKSMSFQEWRTKANKKSNKKEVMYNESTDYLMSTILGGGNNGTV